MPVLDGYGATAEIRMDKIEECVLPQALVSEFEHLSSCVGNYKFKDAIETLNAILENIPEEN